MVFQGLRLAPVRPGMLPHRDVTSTSRVLFMSLVDLLLPANPISRQHRHAGNNAHAGVDEVGPSGNRLGASGQVNRRGELPAAEIERLNTDGMKALEARWGSQAAAKLELARGMIREAR
jgi:hypothetical protein